MSKQEIINSVVIVLLAVMNIFNIFKQLKLTNEFLEEEKKYVKRLIAKTKKEANLKAIIINAKTTKENYFETLEKIERELFDETTL